MSHCVQYLFPADGAEPGWWEADPLLCDETKRALRAKAYPVELEVAFNAGSVQVHIDEYSGFFEIWTHINYARFLYAGEGTSLVAALDQWMYGICTQAIRLDEFHLKRWEAHLYRNPRVGPVPMDELVSWLENEDPEHGNWTSLGPA